LSTISVFSIRNSRIKNTRAQGVVKIGPAGHAAVQLGHVQHALIDVRRIRNLVDTIEQEPVKAVEFFIRQGRGEIAHVLTADSVGIAVMILGM
jgi:hypothetical protein